MHSIFRMISTYNFFSSLRPLVRNLKLITFTYMFTIFCVLTQVLDRSLVNSYGFHAHNSSKSFHFYFFLYLTSFIRLVLLIQLLFLF
jgi:hypothetical protein